MRMRRIAILFAVFLLIGGLWYALLKTDEPNIARNDSDGASSLAANAPADETMATGAKNIGPIVGIGGIDVRVILADTPEKRTQGLSGRSGLAENEGMLFVFPEEGIYGFWMKDMNFSIDIIWIDNAGTVVHVAESVPPDSYPTSFSPSKPAKYVLEVEAGFAKAHQVSPGSGVSLSL